MTNEQLAPWLAALIDGEGSIILVSTTGGTTIRVMLTNTDLPLLKEVQTRLSAGFITPPQTRTNHPRWINSTKPWYHWKVIRKSHVKNVLQLVQPYLEEADKKVRCEIGLAILNTYVDIEKSERHAKYETSEDLKRIVLRLALLKLWRSKIQKKGGVWEEEEE
jgi:hypothetical protein